MMSQKENHLNKLKTNKDKSQRQQQKLSVGYFDPKVLKPVGDVNADAIDFLNAGTNFYLP